MFHSKTGRMLALFACAAMHAWCTTYNPATAFEAGFTAGTNPNGVWSYGYSSGATSSVTLFTNKVQGGLDSSNEQLWLTQSINDRNSPAVEYNNGPEFNDGNVSAAADQIILVAGIQGQYADLVFTAPSAGSYSLSGSFTSDQVNIGDFVGIAVDGSSVFSSVISTTTQTATFSDTLALNAGDTVVFSDGPDHGLQNVGLNLMISTGSVMAPEPSSIALLGAGFVLFAGVCKRRAGRAS